jgi:hypothetical protein
VETVSVKLVCSVAEPAIKGGTVSHVWTVIYCSVLVSLGHLLTYLLTPWSRVLPEKLTSELCS